METRICRISKEPFVLSDAELAHYARMDVPPPTISPLERLRALMATRNEWKLYRRKCDATGKEIISAYPPDSSFTVYNNATWWGDSWDPLSYGRDFDFSRPFFEQFAQLQRAVPREGTTIFNSENCDYNSHIRLSKNCYLNSLVVRCEDLYYSYWMAEDKDTMDSAYANYCTLCFYSSDINRCYHCVVLHESNDCNDCYFSYQLQGCDNCIFSSNLVRKSYYAFNKPVSKEEFEALKEKTLNGSFAVWQHAYQEFLTMRSEAVHRGFHTLKSENCSGDHVYNSKNCINCYDCFESEDCFNAISVADSKDIYNSYSAGWSRCELVHNCCVSRTSTNIAFCTYTWFSNNLRYCDSCVQLKNCFGCIGLKHKEYCILNKPYTKEEYEKLMPKIIEHMKKTAEFGEFFPSQLSPYAFNETAAMDFFPLSKEEALARGWRWRDEDAKEFVSATLKQIPDSISEITDGVTREILACQSCQKNYRIIPKELHYYRQEKIPLPRKCSTCRFNMMMTLRNLPILQKRTCSKCGGEIESTYKAGRKETIYCEKCYLEAVY